MSDLPDVATEPTDAELIGRVRTGDLDAYGVLFSRHREAGQRLARQLVPGPDADDLAAEGFSRVLTALQNGKGPDEFFRAYLLTSIRHLHVDRIRASKRVKPTGDEAELDRAVAFVDPAEMRFEQSTAAAAFASLPERWQLVLWHLDVEGQKPAQLAPLLGMSPNSVSALAYRAREGLRTAYLQGHLSPALDDACRRTTPLLAQHVRNTLSKRDAARVDEHLNSCTRCAGLFAELREVNTHLAGLLAPALLGTAAAGYLASSGSVAAAGFLAQLGERVARPFRSAAGGTSTGVAVGLAAVVAVAIVAGGVAISHRSGDDDRQAGSPGASPAPASASPPSIASPKVEPEGEVPSQPSGPVVVPALPPAPYAPPARQDPPVAEPTTDPPAKPSPRPTYSPTPTLTPTPEPTPSPTAPGPTATNYSTSVSLVNEPVPYQRRATTSVTPTGAAPAGNTLSVAFAFAGSGNAIYYRGGLSPDWSCDEPSFNQQLASLTCSRVQTGAPVPELEFSIFGCNPQFTATLSVSNNVGTIPGPALAESTPYLGAPATSDCQDPAIP